MKKKIKKKISNNHQKQMINLKICLNNYMNQLIQINYKKILKIFSINSNNYWKTFKQMIK